MLRPGEWRRKLSRTIFIVYLRAFLGGFAEPSPACVSALSLSADVEPPTAESPRIIPQAHQCANEGRIKQPVKGSDCSFKFEGPGGEMQFSGQGLLKRSEQEPHRRLWCIGDQDGRHTSLSRLEHLTC